MRRTPAVLAMMVSAFILTGCAKGAADTAIKAAEAAVAEVQPLAQEYVPQQFAEVSQALTDARARFDAGDYKAAMDAAKDLPARAQELMTAATAKKEEVAQALQGMMASLPATMDSIGAKLAALSKSRRLPSGLTAAGLEEAKQAAAAAGQQWTEAKAAFDGGKMMEAFTKGSAVQETANRLMATLGMTAGPPAAK